MLIGFIIGIFVGGTFGIIVMGVLQASRDDDTEQIGRIDKKCPKCGKLIPPWADGKCADCDGEDDDD